MFHSTDNMSLPDNRLHCTCRPTYNQQHGNKHHIHPKHNKTNAQNYAS